MTQDKTPSKTLKQSSSITASLIKTHPESKSQSPSIVSKNESHVTALYEQKHPSASPSSKKYSEAQKAS